MRITRGTALVVLLVMNLMANPALLAWGNPVPGRWEKVVETKPGDWMTIYTKDGFKQNCRYQLIDDFMNEQYLICTDKNDTRFQFELSSVDKITVHKAGKYATRGALLGAAGGAGVMGTLVTSNPGDLTTPGQF